MKSILFSFLIFISISSAGQFIQDTVVVYFPFDQYVLTQATKQKLNTLINTNKEQQINDIVIKGHCDHIGSHDYNDRLSKQRTNSVQNYLLNNGITPSSIKLTEGYGERAPITSNNTAEERALNRRVEIIWQRKEESTTKVPDPKPEPRIVPVIPQDTVPVFSRTTIDTAKEGQTLLLRNINFYGGRHTFLPQSTSALNELLDVMKSYPKLVIEIQGHICCRHGSEQDGLDYDSGDDRLSYNRARAVYYFLAQNGINKRRMTYRGFAGKFPLISPELTEEDRTRNRRVEIKIIKK